MVGDGKLENHIGCLAGFLHIFDPLPGRLRRRRILRSSPRRLPGPTPPSVTDGGSACSSPTVSEEIPPGKASYLGGEILSPAPQMDTETVSIKTTTAAAPVPVFEFKEGGRLPWKFSKETPRLSLDSRASALTDARGRLDPRKIHTMNHTKGLKDEANGGEGDEDAQWRSPSVIARLMGLENLPLSDPNNPQGRMELRRSASDSRINKEIYQFIEGGNYSCDYPKQGSMASIAPAARLPMKETSVGTKMNARREPEKSAAMQLQKGGTLLRKSYYNSADFFPEFDRSAQIVTLYEVIGKKLRARGINEPSKDLDSLKQILESMQLKGLLHGKAGNGIDSLRNWRTGFNSEESPIVLMRPRRSSRRNRSESQPTSRSPIRGRVPTRDGSRGHISNGRRPPEDWKKASGEQRRTPQPRSPRAIAARKVVPDRSMTYRTNHEKVITVSTAEDETSTVSESSIRTPSTQTDNKKSKLADEGSREGRSLQESCDLLLNSMAQITAASAAAAELQPSPVSVLDRSIYNEFEGPSLTKLGPQFKDCTAELTDEDAWCPKTRSVMTKFDHGADDCDFAYVSGVVGASNYFPGDPDLFELLEKWWYLHGKDASSPASRLHRKLTFDVVLEILDRSRNSHRLKHALWTVPDLEKADLGQIWSEYGKIREDDSPSESEDLLESVRGILRKDIAGKAADGWVGQHKETTQSAVDIERLIFKDVIGETIRDLAIPMVSDGTNLSRGHEGSWVSKTSVLNSMHNNNMHELKN